MEIKVGVVCDRGLNPKRPVNQDNYLSVLEHGLFAVFDGVGGQRAGEVASHMAAETIEESLATISHRNSHDLIRRAVTFANRDIYEQAESDPAYKTMATTIALTHIEGNQATLAHVGDSRIYRLEDGYFYRETVDHTDYNDALRDGLALTSAGGSNVINRALGVEPDVEVEIKTITVSDGVRLLLCSDGIYRHLADEEIATVLAQIKDPQEAADELKRLVLARGADDNLTAIVVQLGRARLGRVLGVDDGLSQYRNNEGNGAGARRQQRVASGVKRPAEPQRAAGNTTPNSRIEVAFKNEAANLDDSPWDWQRKNPDIDHRVEGRSTRSRTFVWILALLVGGAAVFYAGVWVADSNREKADDALGLTDTTSRLQAAREAFENGDGKAAAVELERLLSSEPQNTEAHFWLGRVRLEQGEVAKARESFEEAIRLQPTKPDVYLYAAAALKVAGERAKAEAMLEKYLVELRKGENSGARNQ